jgi:hypothetical protein
MRISQDIVKKGTFSSEGGYKALWKPCMALAELSGSELNRTTLKRFGMEELMDNMMAIREAEMYAPTQVASFTHKGNWFNIA